MKEETKLVSLQLPMPMFETIKALAKDNNISITSYIRLKLTEAIKKDQTNQ